MPLSKQAIDSERERIAQLALDLVDQRGGVVEMQTVIAESGLSRARFGEIFENEDDFYDVVAAYWLRPNNAAMEEVMASDLPPNRKIYEFFRTRFVISRDRYRENPAHFAIICEMGADNFERIRSSIDLADHYLCELIAEAQAEGFFAGLEIDEALSLINQMVAPYTLPDALINLGDKLTEEKLARIIDTIFAGLSGETGSGAGGVNTLRIAT